MSDRILPRYAAGRQHTAKFEEPANDDAIDDLGCFAWLRGMRERAPMLEFRRKDGRSVAYDYSLLRKVEFDPSEGITLHIDEEKIRIIGRNLDDESRPGIQLLRGIHYRRVPWVRELDEDELFKAPEATTVIERFDFKGAR
jgi:hypothetical protein